MGYAYKDIPIHATLGTHETSAAEIVASLPQRGLILELGAGSGAFSSRLTDQGFKVIASDLNGEGFIITSFFTNKIIGLKWKTI
jgi:2-polyprenyl-3-methyl-5-hydroxy-6-metoxy-1,4-benzoquinol methylase